VSAPFVPIDDVFRAIELAQEPEFDRYDPPPAAPPVESMRRRRPRLSERFIASVAMPDQLDAADRAYLARAWRNQPLSEGEEEQTA
jgi:hypothetical protein